MRLVAPSPSSYRYPHDTTPEQATVMLPAEKALQSEGAPSLITFMPTTDPCPLTHAGNAQTTFPVAAAGTARLPSVTHGWAVVQFQFPFAQANDT